MGLIALLMATWTGSKRLFRVKSPSRPESLIRSIIEAPEPKKPPRPRPGTDYRQFFMSMFSLPEEPGPTTDNHNSFDRYTPDEHNEKCVLMEVQMGSVIKSSAKRRAVADPEARIL